MTGRGKANTERLGPLQERRQTRNEYSGGAGRGVVNAAEATQSGSLVIEAKQLSKSYDGRDIVTDSSTRIRRGDRIGIVGPNGSGKTTLINLLTGTLAPDSGTLRLGANLAMATLEQRRDSLDPNATLAETLTGGHGDTVMVGDQKRHVIGYMRDFLFGEQTRTLSSCPAQRGCWRWRWPPSNAGCRMSRPTISIWRRSTLEEMLGAYAGTVLVISHDRDFDRGERRDHAERNGRWLEYAGGYSDMLAQRGADLARLPVASRAKGVRRRAWRPTPRRANAGSASTRSMRWKPCRRPSPACRPKSTTCIKNCTIRICTNATALASTPPRWRWPKRRPN